MDNREQKSFRLDNSRKAYVSGLIAIGSVIAVKVIDYFVDSRNIAIAIVVGIALVLMVSGLIMMSRRK